MCIGWGYCQVDCVQWCEVGQVIVYEGDLVQVDVVLGVQCVYVGQFVVDCDLGVDVQVGVVLECGLVVVCGDQYWVDFVLLQQFQVKFILYVVCFVFVVVFVVVELIVGECVVYVEVGQLDMVGDGMQVGWKIG